MKKISFSIIVFSTSVAHAACQLPNTVEGKDFVMAVSNLYSPNNPMAGNVYKMEFHSDGTYNYRILNNGNYYSGRYKYQRVGSNIGVISSEEMFGSTHAKYTLTLMCDNAYSGVYFYQQSDGVSGGRSNISRYFSLN